MTVSATFQALGSANARKWYLSFAVAYCMFLVCNLFLEWWFLEPIFAIRLGAKPDAKLNDREVTEVLARAGGLRQVDANAQVQGGQEALVLLQKLGLVVTFDNEHKPQNCYVKWYPNGRRGNESASGPATPPSAQPSPTPASATTSSTTQVVELPTEPDTLLRKNSIDPAAVNMIITATHGTTMSYRFAYAGLNTEPRTIISRQGGQWLAIRPVNVRAELNEVSSEFIQHIQSFNDTHIWRNALLNGGSKGDYTPPRDEDARHISLAVDGILALLFSRFDDSQQPNPARPSPKLRDATLASRIVNGSNVFGWIQLVIALVFVRGLFAAIMSHDTAESVLATTCIDSLPALGFLGTLLGMAIAFSSGLEDRTNLTQSLTLAISTSALALVGALAIMWCQQVRK